jgi:hypothetical protein
MLSAAMGGNGQNCSTRRSSIQSARVLDRGRTRRQRHSLHCHGGFAIRRNHEGPQRHRDRSCPAASLTHAVMLRCGSVLLDPRRMDYTAPATAAGRRRRPPPPFSSPDLGIQRLRVHFLRPGSSFNGALSSSASARSRFSFELSASSSFNRLASDTVIPAYFAFQLEKVASEIPCRQRRSFVVRPGFSFRRHRSDLLCAKSLRIHCPLPLSGLYRRAGLGQGFRSGAAAARHPVPSDGGALAGGLKNGMREPICGRVPDFTCPVCTC